MIVSCLFFHAKLLVKYISLYVGATTIATHPALHYIVELSIYKYVYFQRLHCEIRAALDSRPPPGSTKPISLAELHTVTPKDFISLYNPDLYTPNTYTQINVKDDLLYFILSE